MAKLTKRGGAAITVICLLTVNVAGCGSMGDDDNINRGATVAAVPTGATAGVPGVPIGVTATPAAEQVTVSWTAVAGATSYNVYRSTTDPVTIATGTKVTVATTSSVQTGLVDGTAYFFIVTAVNGAGESAPSLQVTATPSAAIAIVPAAPIGVTAVGGAAQVTVSWTVVAGATSYNVYRSTINPVVIGAATTVIVTVTTTSSVQTGLVNGTAYFFIVTAVDAVGEGAPSAQVTATPNVVVALDGAALYTANCSGCHFPLATSEKRGATAARINAGIASVASMRTTILATNGGVPLTPAQIDAIVTALQ